MSEFARLLELQRPAEDGELADLLALSAALPAALHRAMPAEPAPEFRQSLRDRLSAVPVPVEKRTPAPSPRPGAERRKPPRPQRTPVRVLGTAVAVGIVICMGMALLSSRALPGDPLYGLKRTVEDIRMALPGSQTTQGERLLTQATTRLDEAGRLVTGPDASPIAQRQAESLVEEARGDATRGITLLLGADQRGRDPAVLSRLEDFRAESTRQLAAVASNLPARSGEVAAFQQVLSGLQAELDRRGARTPGASPSTPGGGSATVTPSAPPGAPTTAPPAGGPAGVQASPGGATVSASVPGGPNGGVVVGPTPSASVCIPIPLVSSC